MRFRNWLAIAASAIITSSCGENSTKQTSGTDTTNQSSTSETTTYNSESNNSAMSVNVPEPTRTAFTTKYPNAANVTWRKYEPVNTIEWDWTGWPTLDTGDYVVTYNADGTEYWTWYDNDNNWVGTITTVSDHSSLPSAVSNRIKTDFDGYTIVSIDKENDKNRTAYEIELSKGDAKAKVLIDESGKVLKKKTMGADGTSTKEKTN